MARKMRIKGLSYSARVAAVNRIYDEHAKSGLSNREILRRYIYPVYPISERTFYNMVSALTKPKVQMDIAVLQLELF